MAAGRDDVTGPYDLLLDHFADTDIPELIRYRLALEAKTFANFYLQATPDRELHDKLRAFESR